MQPEKIYLNHTTIKVSGELIKLNTIDIILFEASDKYIKVITTQRSYLIHSTINGMVKGLAPIFFCKVNRSCIVSMHHVIKLTKNLISIDRFEVLLQEDCRDNFIQRLNVLN